MENKTVLAVTVTCLGIAEFSSPVTVQTWHSGNFFKLLVSEQS